MGQCVEVCRAGAVAHPQPFLSRRLKAGIVTLTLCTQGVCSLETEAAAVNGKPVIRGDDPVFNATPVFLPVIPVFVVTRANIGFGLTEWAAEFLPGTIIVGGFAIFVHSQSSITDQVTCRKSFALGIAFFEGDKSFPIIDRFHGVVDAFRVVALIREKGTPLQREDLVGCGEDVNGNCGIHDVGLGGQFVERQPGNAVHDLREPLTFHNDKRTDHGFFGEAPPPGCRSGQREVQAAEKLVIKHGGALGCEQRHILNDFLSVDSGQPLSGWFSLKSILPKRGSAFYTI